MSTRQQPFLRAVRRRPPDSNTADQCYSARIASLRNLQDLPLNQHVTFFVGENGSGKSTLLEAIACLAGFNPEGGSRHANFETREEEPAFARHLRLVRNPGRWQTEFFLRAETFFNFSTYLERLPGGEASYGGQSLHQLSHGEAFLAVAIHRFGPEGLYLLDEPEAALSPQHQLSFLAKMHELVNDDSQFIVATHSPILMAFPNARIYHFGDDGISPRDYEQTDHFQITRDFLNHRERYLQHLFG